jgi:hypothetical protein
LKNKNATIILSSFIPILVKIPDEFGIKHVNIFYNKSENKSFCLLDAPNKEAVEKHHEKAGFKCDWIIEVESTSEL